jgi:hypothetical protein
MSYRDVKQTVNNVRTPSYSFSGIHKYIPSNEATEKKGQRQLARRTAVENEEEVAGEDTKIKRPKAEEVKDIEMGVGHVSSAKPFDAKIKKQLADLKALIKGEQKPDFIDLDKDGDTEEPMAQAAKDIETADVHTMDDVDTAGLLSEQQKDIEKPADVESTSLGEAIGIERPRIK